MSDGIAVSRRHFVLAGALLPGASLGLAGCSASGASSMYDEAAARMRQPLLMAPGGTVPMRELVRYATLAPSSHNTQCWKFRVEGTAVELRPDLSRRCPAVNPDDHHLFVSLGCATENLVQTALANGLHGEVGFGSSPADALRIELTQTRAVSSPWFAAIPGRQSARTEFDGKPLSVAELNLLEQAGAGRGVGIRLLTDKPTMEQVLEFVVAGNSNQMNDAAFMKELKQWIRFSDTEARLRALRLAGHGARHPHRVREPAGRGGVDPPALCEFARRCRQAPRSRRALRSRAGYAGLAAARRRCGADMTTPIISDCRD